jgi:hypothetical protein
VTKLRDKCEREECNIGTTGTLEREILITATRQSRFQHMQSGLGRDCFEI